MSWWTFRRYQVWVINTDREASLYKWENWRKLMPAVTRLLELTKEKPFIRSSQSYEFESKWLGFGRMEWSDANNEKWTSKYLSNRDNRKVLFFDTEIWAPDWNACLKRSVPPDVYVRLYNYGENSIAREGLIVAIPQRLVSKNKDIVESQLSIIEQHIPNSTSTSIVRSWEPWFRHLNHIEDMNSHEIEEIIRRGLK